MYLTLRYIEGSQVCKHGRHLYWTVLINYRQVLPEDSCSACFKCCLLYKGFLLQFHPLSRMNLLMSLVDWRRKWQPTPVFLPGESRGQRSLEGYSPWGHKSRTRLSD